MSRIDEIRAMLNEGNETIIANRAVSSLRDLLGEIDVLRTDCDRLRVRCEAAEDDLSVERGCLSCWYMDEDCPSGCESKGSSMWKWRGPNKLGDEQSAPGDDPVSETCQRS